MAVHPQHILVGLGTTGTTAATATTGAPVLSSLTVLRAEVHPTCQQTSGRLCTSHEAEALGRQRYGCQEFGP